MGLFDLLKKNKNIVTDNGLNVIYYDNGRGSIKEKFSKINGVVNGEYVEYDRDGTFRLETYKDGERCLTDKEKNEIKLLEERDNKIRIEVKKLEDLDKLISEITGIYLLVQMENSTIDSFAKVIENKFSKQFDEEYIKFYLYSKRNYFIKNLLQSGESKDLNICFSEQLKNYKAKRINSIRPRWEYWNYDISDDIIDIILQNKIRDKKLICKISIDEDGINKDVFLQESILFGLNHKDYMLIHEILLKSEELRNKQESDEMWEKMKKDFGPVNENWPEIFKPKKINEPIKNEVIIERAVKEIKLVCNMNKVNQEDIAINI